MKKLVEVIVWEVIILIAGLIVIKDTFALIKILFAYLWLIFFPGLIWVYPLRQDILATLVLSNLAGFAAGLIYFVIDMFGVPITAETFLIVPIFVSVLGIAIHLRYTLAKTKEINT